MGRLTHQRSRCFFYAILSAIVMFLICLSGQVLASERVQVNMISEGERVVRAEFWARGRLIGRLPRNSSQQAFNDKVYSFQTKLEKVFNSKAATGSIQARPQGNIGIVYFGNEALLAFDEGKADAPGMSALQVAEKWASNIRFALTLPSEFNLQSTSLVIPINEEINVSYSGNVPSNLEFINVNEDIINVRDDRTNRRVIVRGTKLGSGSFRVKSQNTVRTVNFSVRERAGFVPQHITINVSGNPAGKWMLINAFNSTIRYRSMPKNDTFFVIGNPLRGSYRASLLPGEKHNLTIPVKVDGPSYIPAVQNVHVTFENVRFPRPDPELLYLSNKPELVEKDGELFEGVIEGKKPVRYFYHHYNNPVDPWRNFHIALKNESNENVRVFVSPLGAGPTPDEIFAGHLAALNYFEYMRSRMGWFIDIRPQTTYMLETRQMKSAQTISGVGYINVIEGAGLKMTCYAVTPPGAPFPGHLAKPVQRNFEPRTARGIFPAYIKLNPVHDMGGFFTYIFLGGEPFQEDVFNGNPNYGNYGAIYDLNITVNNPRNETRDARIYFIPRGGVARGILEIDGTLMETPLVSNSERILLKRVTVPPGESSNVKIVTMPQGGSYYPVKIVVESEFVRQNPNNPDM
jgi:hypothetical protein